MNKNVLRIVFGSAFATFIAFVSLDIFEGIPIEYGTNTVLALVSACIILLLFIALSLHSSW